MYKFKFDSHSDLNQFNIRLVFHKFDKTSYQKCLGFISVEVLNIRLSISYIQRINIVKKITTQVCIKKHL